MEHLKKQPNPPYFLSYEVIETESMNISGSFGALVSSTPLNRRRQLGIDLRVGSYQLDNTHPIGRDGQFLRYLQLLSNAHRRRSRRLEGHVVVLYRSKIQTVGRAVHRGENQRQGKRKRQINQGISFSAKAETYDEPNPAPLAVNRTQWEDKVRKYTAPFQRYGNIYSVNAAFSAAAEPRRSRLQRWYAAIHTADTGYRLNLSAFAKASDGMELPRFENLRFVDPRRPAGRC